MDAVTGNRGAATEHTGQPQLAASGSNDVATEHAQEPAPARALQVLLHTDHIQQLCREEKAIRPQRSLQKLAR